MTAKSDLLIEELVSAAVAFGRGQLPDWQTRIESAQRELREYIAELEAERRWIPVSERLPEDLQSVVIITNDSMTGIVRYLELYGREGFGAWSEDVTHWMPIPKLPEVQDV